MPTMEADFNWGDVEASTPIHPKGDYELTIVGVRGAAWPKTDKAGNTTGVVVERISFRPRIVGVYNSEGKLKSELNGKEIRDKGCEGIAIWLHSSGGREMGKRTMMAILGYNPQEEVEEKKFNKFLKDSGVDLGWKHEENEAGDGYVLTIGEGYEKLFVGKSVRVQMEPETRTVEGKEPRTSQNYMRISPVN